MTDQAELPAPPAATLVAQAERRLRAAGIAGAQRDAAALAAHVFAAGAALGGPCRASEEQVAAYLALVERRCRREPLERLIGRVRFRTIELLVGHGVFVPQPETSCVVQWAVDRARELVAAGIAAPLCVDLCTGSGTIALALAAEVPQARVHAVEVDDQAFPWAQRNAERLGLDVTLHHGDAGSALAGMDGSFDLVASNPPYVATAELDLVRPEVRDHDPLIALGAGTDGLEVIRSVERAARRLLRPGGLVVVEHSDRQGRSAPAVFSAAGGWADIQDHQDHDRLDRFVTARLL